MRTRGEPADKHGGVTDSRASARMLRRKPTRIELKPDDREEYFAHKQSSGKSSTDTVEQKDKPSEKDVRIGLAKTR